MARGLCDAGVDKNDQRLQRAIEWCNARQQLGQEADWRIYNPKSVSGRFAFE